MVMLLKILNKLKFSGNYLECFSKHYFTEKHCTPWGPAPNFDMTVESELHVIPVRKFFIENAVYWLKEFHFGEDNTRVF